MPFTYPSRPKSSHQTSSPSPLRQASTTSSHSGLSNTSELPSRAPSNASNGLRLNGTSHRRGQSEVTLPTPTEDGFGSKELSGASSYQAMRSKLRPLSLAPGQAPVSPPISPEKTSPEKTSPPTTHSPRSPPTTHSRSKSLAPALSPPPSLDKTVPKLHSRSQSLEPSSAAFLDGSTSPTKTRPYSLAISRSDSVRAPTHERSKSHTHFAPEIDKPDLESLAKSTTGHLRTLSKFAENADEDFTIKSPDEEVVGLHGRRRLQRGKSMRKAGQSSWSSVKWMEQQRQFLQAYEYLCHIGEAKEWIEDVIQQPIPPIVQLEEALRDGVTLAEIVQALYPDKPLRIFRHPKLQFRHSDNIALFFRLLADVELPELFRFELVDLYEKKNIPKVIYCIHALSWLLFRKGILDFRIGNLVGQLQFEDHELEEMQKGLDKSGVSMPNFSGMSANFGEPEPEPEPVETEEERIERELAENEDAIIDLQAQIRGCMERLRLGDFMQALWDNEEWFVDLQSRVRGDFARQIAYYKLDMARFAVNLQSAVRGFNVRSRQRSKERYWQTKEKDIVMLQSLVRARKARVQTQQIRTQMRRHESGIRKFQAAIKGALKRREVGEQYEGTREAESEVQGLQAAIRGALLRGRIEALLVEAHDAEASIESLQSAIRGALLRKKIGDQQAKTVEAGAQIELLQSLARGMLLRQEQHTQQDSLRQHEDLISLLQGAIRGAHVRKVTEQVMDGLSSSEANWMYFQAAMRGKAIRDSLNELRENLYSHEDEVTDLQSRARGNVLRVSLQELRKELNSHEDKVIDLQSGFRGMVVRSSLNNLRENLNAHKDDVVDLQSRVRGNVLRDSLEELRENLRAHEDKVIDLQSWFRGIKARATYAATLESLEEHVDSVLDLQSRIRGHLFRNKHFADLQALEDTTDSIVELQSAARGFNLRNHVYDTICELTDNDEQIVALQSLARAMLVRLDVGDLLAQLDMEEEVVCELQSLARGNIIRSRFQEKKKFYHENMQKVVKIQSFVRGRQQGEAYKSLTTGKNPPVGTVKNFVHLLNDSDFDFDEEMEFEHLRKTVVQHVRQNEMAEQYIDQLDIKIALLVKNKITLDEVVRHQRHFGGHVGGLLANKDLASKDPFDLRALNRNSRKKLEHYQELFFILQTQPQYMARLFRHIRETGTAEKECKRIELLMMGLFGYAQKRREEYYLLKLISRSIKEEVDAADSLQDYLRGNFFWSKLLGNYIRSPRDRKFLRDLLGPLIKENIMENEGLDLESDPMQIYRSAINNEELRTGQRSRRHPDIPREEAIRDPETRETFIHHLQDLRDIADQFFASVEDCLHRMPYGMRFVAQQTFEMLCSKFPQEEQIHLLQIVGQWLWKQYLQPAILQPETWGVIDRGLSPLQKRNLGEVSKVLSQVAAGRLFGGENVYLQPLNSYLTEAIGRIEEIWTNLISISPAEAHFDIDEYNDLYNTQKPTLYIKLADIFAIHQLVASDLSVICTAQEDTVLREILRELGSAGSNERELSGVSSTEISLTLNPKFHNVEDPDAPIKALFMETKRCVLYIIRIQTGPDLLSIMIKPITDEDENRWAALLHEEMALHNTNKTAYTDGANTLVDITTVTYTELKRIALENILTLEQAGRINRHNKYQDLLNEIAIDIRTKHRRRIQRAREIENVKATLAALDTKAEWLDSQLKSYNDYIEQAMVTLQNKKGKKRFLLPFTKQYNHERELQRRGQVPKFGSFKYSARALGEKGVLVEWRGYTDKERGWEKTNITISSDEVGIFHIEGSVGSMIIPGASAMVPLDDLLQAQFENKMFMNLFGAEGSGEAAGALKLNVNLLLHLIFKKFYRDGEAVRLRV